MGGLKNMKGGLMEKIKWQERCFKRGEVLDIQRKTARKIVEVANN